MRKKYALIVTKANVSVQYLNLVQPYKSNTFSKETFYLTSNLVKFLSKDQCMFLLIYDLGNKPLDSLMICIPLDLWSIPAIKAC